VSAVRAAIVRLRRKEPEAPLGLPDVLRGLRDGLRAGLSLRQALERAAGRPGSPLAGLDLEPTRPLVDVLYAAARGCTDPDLATTLLVLAVQARTGGDPGRCVEALIERSARRTAAAREARALTAQARLSARAMLALTPGFLLLLTALDPRGTWSALTSTPGGPAVALGIALQAAGGWWISRIVSGATGEVRGGRLSRVPVLRVVAGRRSRNETTGPAVAQGAEALALVLEAGLSGSRGVAAVAPIVAGRFGAALRVAAARIRAGTPVAAAVGEACAGVGDEAAARFGDVLASGDRLGVPLAGSYRALAGDLEHAEASRLAEDVRRCSIRVLVPLGLLILPAFVLACLVPLFVGGLRGVVG
jgi:Flp pilus assembly protein TadB